MRMTQLFTKTSKTAPADETARNAQLLCQAGYIHKEMAGVYAFLPLGKRVLDNISEIVRQEMNAVGGQEVQMTVLQPKDIFEKTDRWDDAKVDNWFKTKLSNGTELGMGLTHEEPIVDAMKDFISSYKDLPLSVYQIQSKFRNELRAKSGLLRGREFTMKDMYSFSRSQEEHDEMYEKIAVAYTQVYKRLGIGDITHRVIADGGIFTEKYSDEFQTLSPIGEDLLFHVPETDLFFNEEIAPAKAPAVKDVQEVMQPMQEVQMHDVIGVEALAKELGITPQQTTKTMLYVTETGQVVAAAVRGDYQVNKIKLCKVLQVKSLEIAPEETVRAVTGAEVGYAGLLNLPDSVLIIVDESCAGRTNFEMGANKTGCHSINVNWGRDLPEPEEYHDIKIAKTGDIHPESGKVYETHQAVEVGNIFPLESKYPDAFDLFYSDENGEQRSIIMGCYGIGISRLMGMLAEHFSDGKGLVWPESVAPFKVVISQLGGDENVREAAYNMYQKLTTAGVAVLYDDRIDARPGEKFADADLLGIPYRVVVSPKTLAAGKYEVKKRTEDTVTLLDEEGVMKITVTAT